MICDEVNFVPLRTVRYSVYLNTPTPILFTICIDNSGGL